MLLVLFCIFVFYVKIRQQKGRSIIYLRPLLWELLSINGEAEQESIFLFQHSKGVKVEFYKWQGTLLQLILVSLFYKEKSKNLPVDKSVIFLYGSSIVQHFCPAGVRGQVGPSVSHASLQAPGPFPDLCSYSPSVVLCRSPAWRADGLWRPCSSTWVELYI